jgi:ABC-2 type transport system permease protein/capsular polysaccharide transport system permease protein
MAEVHLPPAPTLLRSLSIQRRVIYALLMREIMTRFGRHNIGFLWMFVEPMLFTLGVTALWSATRAVHGSDLPIVAFAVTGYSSVLLWRNMPSRCIMSVGPNLALMYHRNVRVMDIMLARLLLEASGASISFVVLTLVFSSLGWMSLPEDLLKVVWGWLMLGWLGASAALLLGALSEEFELVEKLWHPTSYLLFPLSGAAFLVDIMPPEAQRYILYLPMVHGVEYVRDGFFGSKIVAHHDLSYMASICAVFTLAAFVQIRRVSRIITPE